MHIFFDRNRKNKKEVPPNSTSDKPHYIRNAIVQSIIMMVDLIIVMTFIFGAFSLCIPPGSWINFVDGPSMEPAMKNNQILFTDTGNFKRGDIITILTPDDVAKISPEYKGKTMVKRIVGIPGDTIVINNDGVFINSQKIEEKYLVDKAVVQTYIENGKYNSITLSSNEYFIMGDNRGNSFDSRYFGAVNADNVLYKQSLSPTKNFYIKIIFIIIIFVISLVLYVQIERLLTIGVVYLLNKKDTKNNSIQCDSEKESEDNN